MNIRIGHGYDVHRFGGEKPLMIGGVLIPHSKGLVAHSDGDVVIHAICDAVLGALALGDIGKHFPDTDSQYKDINSRDILCAIVTMLSEQGFTLSNLDVTIIAEEPRLADFISKMRKVIAQDFNAPIGKVSIKATTTEKLGAIGRAEGIAAQAVILIRKD